MALFVRRTPPPPVVFSVPDAGGLDVRALEADGATSPPGASTDKSKNSSPQIEASIASAVVFLIGLVVAVWVFRTDKGPDYSPAEGIGAFALFYIAAQAAERFVELVLPYFEKVPGFGKAEKEIERDQAVAAVSSAATAQAAANAQADVDQLRANRAAVVFGLTAAFGMALCGYLEADFLSSVGVSFADPNLAEEAVMMAVTGLIVGGGAKALHDTITNISKSSDKKSTPAETGGQA